MPNACGHRIGSDKLFIKRYLFALDIVLVDILRNKWVGRAIPIPRDPRPHRPSRVCAGTDRTSQNHRSGHTLRLRAPAQATGRRRLLQGPACGMGEEIGARPWIAPKGTSACHARQSVIARDTRTRSCGSCAHRQRPPGSCSGHGSPAFPRHPRALSLHDGAPQCGRGAQRNALKKSGVDAARDSASRGHRGVLAIGTPRAQRPGLRPSFGAGERRGHLFTSCDDTGQSLRDKRILQCKTPCARTPDPVVLGLPRV